MREEVGIINNSSLILKINKIGLVHMHQPGAHPGEAKKNLISKDAMQPVGQLRLHYRWFAIEAACRNATCSTS
jgi:hypothetical protein